MDPGWVTTTGGPYDFLTGQRQSLPRGGSNSPPKALVRAPPGAGGRGVGSSLFAPKSRNLASHLPVDSNPPPTNSSTASEQTY